MLRQEQHNNNMLRVPGMMPNGMAGMNEYQQMLFRQQQNGMPVNGDLRQKAIQNQNRHFGQYASHSYPNLLTRVDQAAGTPKS